jgi:hypothetical protein
MTVFVKRMIMIAAAACLLTAQWNAWAQSSQGSGDGQADVRLPDGQQPDQIELRKQQLRRLEMLSSRLNFTEDQKRQWIQIQWDTAQKVRAARRDDSLNEQQMQARLKEIHKEHNQKMFAMLSPEQQDNLKKFWEEQKERRQQDKPTVDSNAGPSTPESASGASATEAPATQNKDGEQSQKEDDLFAGMMPEGPLPAQPSNRKVQSKH